MAIPILLLSLFFNLLPIQRFTIIGSVRDTAGRSVPNVRVSVFDENFQPIRTIFVDSSGQFFVRGLSSGRYQFRVETTGTPYQEQETGWIELASLRVRGGGTEQYPLDIVLKFKPGKELSRRAGAVFAQEVPKTARAEYEQGVKEMNGGQMESGLASLTKAIEIFPDYFDALELLGTELVKNGQYQSAIPVLMHAVTVNSRAFRSLYALGVAHLKLDQVKEAIKALNKSADFDPANPNTQMMLGLALRQNQQLVESEAAFKKALQLGGAAMAEAHFYLAGIYEKQKRYADAAKELELYMKESKEIMNRDEVTEMIRKIKEKAKER